MPASLVPFHSECRAPPVLKETTISNAQTNNALKRVRASCLSKPNNHYIHHRVLHISTPPIHSRTDTANHWRPAERSQTGKIPKMAPSSSTPQYAKDEKVLCFHGELLYEAKVLDTKVKDPNDRKDGFMYRVHYKGWKNT